MMIITCDEGDQRSTAVAVCPFLCRSGECIGECAPGARRCSGATAQVCDADAIWRDEESCTGGCNEGLCVTCPPLHPGDTVHVDPQGTDSVGYGSATGRCAFKTITFALTQTDGTVSLTPATYSQETGEKFPLILEARQHLACNGAHIEGQGEIRFEELTIEFDGDDNGLSDCVIRGANGNGYCVRNWGARQVSIERSDISNCGGAAVTIDTGSVSLVANDIHHSLMGVFWYGDGLTGSMVGNRFSGNLTRDIACLESEPMVTGSDNVRGQGPAVCVGCAHCPF